MYVAKLAILLCPLLGLLAQVKPVALPQNWTAIDDHRNMMEQLGIRALRPGPSGNDKAPNHANYDEATANPFPDYPEILRLSGGGVVRTPEEWWSRRRPEIVEQFDREVLGRVPKTVPKVTWKVVRETKDKVGPWPVVARELKGRVENSAFPEAAVEIQMVVVTPAWASKAVPVMMMFGRAALPSDPVPAAFARFALMPKTEPQATVQLIGAGWGYAMLNPTSVQADNGAGLTKGIIGLVNQGQPRKPEDWGALRAWAWGASRGLDYLETDSRVDAKHVGIEGVSRYGKAALVTMAYDTRFAVVLVGSSGEGGAKPHRRNFGEAVENLTAPGLMIGRGASPYSTGQPSVPMRARALPPASIRFLSLSWRENWHGSGRHRSIGHRFLVSECQRSTGLGRSTAEIHGRMNIASANMRGEVMS